MNEYPQQDVCDLVEACEHFIIWADSHPRKCTFSGTAKMRSLISRMSAESAATKRQEESP